MARHYYGGIVPAHFAATRQPEGPTRVPRIERGADLLAPHLTDAAHFTGGHAAGMALPESEADVAAVLQGSAAVLPIGAQSSLTGGATPMGELLLSTARFGRVGALRADAIRVEAGVALAVLDEALARADAYYPPAPTFTGAFVGGTIATNAAGAATFKYGATRQWVEALTIVLASGEVLDLERGRVTAHADGYFDIHTSRGAVRVPLPRYRMPSVPKLSAGYFAAPGMDLIDLFIGAEGTLGVITAATLRVVRPRPSWCLAFVPFADRQQALALVRTITAASIETRRRRDARGVDASAIEHLDRRSLALLREDSIDRKLGVRIPPGSDMALLITLELPPGTGAEAAFDQIGRAQREDAPDTPLVRFCRLLAGAGRLDDVEIAVPGDHARAEQLRAVREAVPAAVNQRIARAQHTVDRRIDKTAGDVVVPLTRVEELLACCEAEFGRRGLDAATWGHVSDGNLHPNVLPRTLEDVEAGRAALLAIGREASRLGGAPLAEHGVGRSPMKQTLLRELYGEDGLEEMRRVKRALDPEWKLAPGVIFQR
jgi:D-lactate dehydrogenase (cytochrome)